MNHSREDYTVGIWRLTDAIDSWTWDGCEGKKAEIIIYSIGKVIELFQSGELIASKELVDYKAEFETIYKPSG